MIRVTPEILNHLNSLIDDLSYTIDRAKYYDEERKTEEFSEEIRKQIYRIREEVTEFIANSPIEEDE